MVCDWWVTKLAIASLLVVEVNNSCALPICAELQQRDDRVYSVFLYHTHWKDSLLLCILYKSTNLNFKILRCLI
jgi:hypothetical protein